MAQSRDFRASARFVIKPRGNDLRTVTPAIERAIAEINPAVDVDVTIVKQSVSNGLVRERLMAALSSAFGALAGLLAAVGLYGTLAFTVMLGRFVQSQFDLFWVTAQVSIPFLVAGLCLGQLVHDAML